MPGKGARFGAGAVLVAALIVGAAWWLMPRGEDTLSADAPAADTSPSSAALPVHASDPVTASLPLVDAVAPASAASVSAGPAARAGVPFTGRVLDEASRPVAHALVLGWPSITVRIEQKLGASAFDGPLDRTRLAQTRTDDLGRFELGVREPPPSEAGAVGFSGVSGAAAAAAAADALVPALIVEHPDFEITLFPCRGWEGGPFPAGDLTVRAAAKVAGRVVDEDGRPIAGVTVQPPAFTGRQDFSRTYEWDAVSKLLGTTTGEDGRFLHGSLWAGQTPMSFLAPGRRPLMQVLVLHAGETLDLGDVRLERGDAIRGFVVDAQGRAIAGARVVARPAGMHHPEVAPADQAAWEFSLKMAMNGLRVDLETSSDASGAFELIGLPRQKPASTAKDSEPEAFKLVAGADGYEPTLLPSVTPGGEAVTLRLQPAASVEIRLIDPTSREPVTGATVKAYKLVAQSEWKSKLPAHVVTEPAALEAAGVPPPWEGVYLLQSLGLVRNEAIVSAPGRATKGFVLPTVAPGERKSVTLGLPRAARLAGRVLDGEGGPVAGAQLSLKPPATLRVELEEPRTSSDAEGRFVFDQLSRGDWILRGAAAGFVDGESAPITVRQEAAVEGVELVLQRAGAVAGVVLVAGAPAAGLTVRAAPPLDRSAPPPAPQTSEEQALASIKLARASAQTDLAGRFRIEDLAPGRYELTGPPGVTQLVEVRAGETTEVALAAHKNPRLRGRTLDGAGPVAGAQVEAHFKTASGGWVNDVTTTSNRAGEFELELYEPGSYRLTATEQGDSRPVEVAVDWDAELWIELRFDGGIVQGIVVDEAGAPIPEAGVWLVFPGPSPASKWRGDASTDADGAFRILRAPAGPLELSASHDDFAQSAPLLVNVSEGRAADVRLVLARAGVVAGCVTASGGLGTGLRVRFVPLAAQAKEARLTLKDDGCFERRQLAPGPWRCELYRRTSGVDGPVLASQEVDVKADEAQTANFALG